MIGSIKKKRKRIMVAKETRIDIIEFDTMYRANIQAHIDYQAQLAGLTPHGKSINTIINPGKKYNSFEEFVTEKMKDYSEANYGDVVLTEFDKEIKRVKSNFKVKKDFKNAEDTKPTSGSFPKAHEK
jgi:hypothetical protein